MENSLGLKLGAIALLSIVLLAGLIWIGSIVTERQTRRDAVVQEIAASSSDAQRLEGPILVVPYEKTVREWKEDAGSGNRHAEERQIRGQMLILPEVFRVDGKMPTELRQRGIYEARLYHANLRIQANFQVHHITVWLTLLRIISSNRRSRWESPTSGASRTPPRCC